MKTFKLLLSVAVLFASILLMAAPASAEDTPEAFLQSIYAQYRSDDGKQAPGIYLDNETAIRTYFEPATADLIIQDNAKAKKSGDVPALSGDPFIGAQQWGISSFNIRVLSQNSFKAVAEVEFNSLNKDVKNRIFLTHTNGGWKISNILWQSNGDGSLLDLYKK